MTRDRSISFDRIAAIYDATRGGLERGAGFAVDIAPWIAGPRVLEVGVGTGAIAQPLSEVTGMPVLGIDLAPAMLSIALDRLGPRISVGDAERLPIASVSVNSVVVVWVLQLVSDVEAALGEIARVLRPGGHLALLLSKGIQRPDDIDSVTAQIYTLSGGRPRVADDPDRVAQVAADAGLVMREYLQSTEQEWDETPIRAAERLEQRTYGFLLDMDDESFESDILPVARTLRALPEPDRARRRANRHHLLFCTKAGG